MKKMTSKLRLGRETIRILRTGSLVVVAGGGGSTDNPAETCDSGPLTKLQRERDLG